MTSGIKPVRLLQMLGMLVGLLAGLAPASAADYPSRPIRLVVPYPAGGPTDVLARLFAQSASEGLGQSIVVENLAGGNTIPGARTVAKAAPDGYTLLLTTGTAVSINQFLYKSLPYDPDKELTAVGKLADNYYFLFAAPTVPSSNLSELVKYAKEHPGQLSFALSGIAGPPAFSMKLLEKAAGISFKAVQYKGDSAFYPDLLAGRVDLTNTSPVGMLDYVKSGQLKAIATTAPKRLPAMPSVEAVAETFPGFEAGSWFGIMAPGGTRPDIIAKLNIETQKFVKNTAYVDQMGQQGMTVNGGSAKDLSDFIHAESGKWGSLIKEMGVSMD